MHEQKAAQAAFCLSGNRRRPFAADDRSHKAWDLTGLHADLWERLVATKGHCGVSGVPQWPFRSH